MKKFCTFCSALIFLIFFSYNFSTSATNKSVVSTESVTINHIIYKLSESAEYYVQGTDSSAEAEELLEIELENEINSIPVTTIDKKAFRNNEKLTKIIIPENITEISSYAFKNCKNLSTVIIKGNLKTIGMYAFENCTELNSIKLTSSLKLINTGAFKNSGLTSITIPGSADAKEAAFKDCKSLQKVIFSNEGCTGEKLVLSPLKFNGCTNLKKIYIYRQVKDIGIYSDCFNQNEAYDAFNLSDIYFFGSEKLWNTLVTEKEAKRFGDVDMHFYYKHSHSFEKSVKKATCVKTGKDTYTCVCGDSFSYQTEKNTNNHSFGEWKTTKKATKTKDGTQEHICKLCNKKETRKLVHVAKLKISTKDAIYTKLQEYNQKVVVKNGKTKLKKGTHYTLEYKNNQDIGTATVIVKGIEKNGYYGSAKITFDIVPDCVCSSIEKNNANGKHIYTWDLVTGATGYKIYRLSDNNYTEIYDVKSAYAELSADFNESELYIKAYRKNNNKIYLSPYHTHL